MVNNKLLTGKRAIAYKILKQRLKEEDIENIDCINSLLEEIIDKLDKYGFYDEKSLNDD